MSRYEHYLAPAKTASFPAQVIAVECVGRHRAIDSSGRIEVEDLVSWHCATMHGKSGSYGKARTWEGEKSISYWKSVIEYMGRGCQTYMLLWRTQRQLSLLRFWSLLEAGELLLSGSDARDSSLKTQRWRRAINGVCICEDPPTVITCRAPGNSGTLTILDVRNYGVDRDTLPSDPQAWCGEILSWFRRATRHLIARKLGGWKTTAASISAHSWRYRHMHTSVLCHTSTSALETERRGYFGGRCECMKIGSYTGPIYHLDFRSLYPFCCTSDDLPVRLIGCWNDYTSIPKDISTSNVCLIADVTLQTDAPDYPYRHNGRIIWPVGRFRTTLPDPELRHAEQSQRICRYHHICAYETAPALRSWVHDWYAIREEADRGRDKLLGSWAKRVLVSLVGKLGQRDPQWLPAPKVVPECPWESWHTKGSDGKIRRYRTFNWSVQVESIATNGADSVPAMAAHITSLARVRLMTALEIAGRSNVYYCDTDSLMCNAEAHFRLHQSGWIRRGELGWLQERGIHDNIDIFNVKHYALDGELKCSGMPSGPLAEGPNASTLWYQLHVRSALRNGTAPKAMRELRDYHREDVYEIGTVLQSGDVVPLRIKG